MPPGFGPDADHPHELPPTSIPLLARPVCWTLGFVAGLVDAALMPAELRRNQARRRWKEEWRRRLRKEVRVSSEPGARRRSSDLPSLSALRATLLGRDRAYIVAALGPPAATSAGPEDQGSLPGKPAHYWHADVWYYPMDIRRRHAIAFIFLKDTVSAIEQLSGPR